MKPRKTESGPSQIWTFNRAGTRAAKRFSRFSPFSCFVDLSGNYPPSDVLGQGWIQKRLSIPIQQYSKRSVRKAIWDIVARWEGVCSMQTQTQTLAFLPQEAVLSWGKTAGSLMPARSNDGTTRGT